MNVHAIRAIFFFEMSRTWRTLLQSIVSPVISTSLYFVVFGAALGSRLTTIDGINYGAFINTVIQFLISDEPLTSLLGGRDFSA